MIARLRLAWTALMGRPIISGVCIEDATVSASTTIRIGPGTTLHRNSIRVVVVV